MNIIIGLLTFILVVDCLFLMLLVLIQLPKKEAGIGTAFGGGATDALFGAGSGTALTQLTKYATTVFFVLALGLSVMNAQRSKHSGSEFEKELQKKQQTIVPPPAFNTNLVTSPSAADTNLGTGSALSALTNSLLENTNQPVNEENKTPEAKSPVPMTESNAPSSSTNAPGAPNQ